MSEDSAFSLKRLLVGRPIPSHLAHHERLSRVTGLAVLSSDALSSVAYATDFILATLVVAGVGAFVYAVPISLVIAALLAIVAFSYRQTIHARCRIERSATTVTCMSRARFTIRCTNADANQERSAVVFSRATRIWVTP